MSQCSGGKKKSLSLSPRGNTLIPHIQASMGHSMEHLFMFSNHVILPGSMEYTLNELSVYQRASCTHIHTPRSNSEFTSMFQEETGEPEVSPHGYGENMPKQKVIRVQDRTQNSRPVRQQHSNLNNILQNLDGLSSVTFLYFPYGTALKIVSFLIMIPR